MKLLSRNQKEYLRHLWRSILFWITALASYAMIRFYGIEYEVGIRVDEEYRQFFSMFEIVLGYSIAGLIIGVLYATIEFYFDKYISKRISIGLNLLFQSVLVVLSVMLVSDFVLRLLSSISGLSFNLELGWWFSDRAFWSYMFYILIASFVFSMLVIVTEKFGRGVFFKLLIGRYKNPKEEWRIFMFLDLKSSTALAEQLGHFKYSQLIQDCFYDLNEITPHYEAEIYQYVGDEAVLSWPYARGMARNNCVHLFFAFQQKIKSKAPFYMEKYGTVPEFKAGLHGGVVMASEIGVVKKELAYHGDVVNTTARIQGECNKHQVLFLVSEKLVEDFGVDLNIQSQFMGSVRLKGKTKEVRIHTVSKVVEQPSKLITLKNNQRPGPQEASYLIPVKNAIPMR